MPFIAGVGRVGIFPGQDHDKKIDPHENTIATRELIHMARVEYKPDISLVDIVDGTVGPVYNFSLWPNSVSVEKHPPVWSIAHACVSEPAIFETCADVQKRRAKKASKTVTRDSGEGSLDKEDKQPWSLVLGEKWDDKNDQVKQLDLVAPFLQKLPGGWPGIMIDSSDTSTQHDLVMPAGGILCAPHAFGATNQGTPVYDIDDKGNLDEKNFARIQTSFRPFKYPPKRKCIPDRDWETGVP